MTTGLDHWRGAHYTSRSKYRRAFIESWLAMIKVKDSIYMKLLTNQLLRNGYSAGIVQFKGHALAYIQNRSSRG